VITREELERPLLGPLLSGVGSAPSWGFGLVTVIEKILERVTRGWFDFWSEFPNPLSMFDEFLRAATGIVGIVVTMPFQGARTIVVAALRDRGIHNRLIRVDDAVDGFFGAMIKMFNEVTLTSENGVFDLFLQMFSRWLYRLIKGLKFLPGLIQAKDEFDFITLVRNSWIKRIRLYKIAVLVLGIAAAVVGISTSVAFLAIPLYWSEIGKKILAQDSKIVRKRRRGRFQYRVNLRAGPDTASG